MPQFKAVVRNTIFRRDFRIRLAFGRLSIRGASTGTEEVTSGELSGLAVFVGLESADKGVAVGCDLNRGKTLRRR